MTPLAADVFKSYKKQQLADIESLDGIGYNKGKLPSFNTGQKSLTKFSLKTFFFFLFYN